MAINRSTAVVGERSSSPSGDRPDATGIRDVVELDVAEAGVRPAGGDRDRSDAEDALDAILVEIVPANLPERDLEGVALVGIGGTTTVGFRAPESLVGSV